MTITITNSIDNIIIEIKIIIFMFIIQPITPIGRQYENQIVQIVPVRYSKYSHGNITINNSTRGCSSLSCARSIFYRRAVFLPPAAPFPTLPTSQPSVYAKPNDSHNNSNGGVLIDEDFVQHHPDFDMETSFSQCTNVNSAKDNVCSIKSSAMMCKSHLQYDQHSSEEELEVINGPVSVAAAEAAAASSSSVLGIRGTSPLTSERGSSSLDADDLQGGTLKVKRSSSTIAENRKRSLAHSSDDDLRNFLEPVLTPVNFRTSPPIEAFKPNRSHMYRSTTPLILQEARCGIENIQLCDNSVNDKNGPNNKDINYAAMIPESNYPLNSNANANTNSKQTAAEAGVGAVAVAVAGAGAGATGSTGMDSDSIIQLKISNSTSSHHIYQPQAKHTFQFNSSRSSPASTTGLDAEVRSVSPPAKLFHCAISPRRRPIRTQHNSQRLQRPHRPCLDFDKMQQVSL